MKVTTLISILTALLFGCSNFKPTSSDNFFTTNGVRLFYKMEGNHGPPLLLLHGGFGSTNDFNEVIKPLSKHFTVIAVDSPGHGKSELADSLSYELMAFYISELIDHLQLDSLYVLGWSDGGNTALLLASQLQDKIKRLMVCGANSNIHGYTEEVRVFLELLSPEFAAVEMKEWLNDYQKNAPDSNHWKKYVEDVKKMWLQDTVISEEKLSEIKQPVMIVLGDRDLTRLEHGIQMYRTIPKAQYCVLPFTSHFMFRERPQQLVNLAYDFFCIQEKTTVYDPGKVD